jgi:hypothetical protein
MGVDVYMEWDEFGEREKGNPNYDNQITGFATAGQYGYLRIAYSNSYYEQLSECLFWDWDKDIEFNSARINRFEELVKVLPEILKEEKVEWLKFAELGRKLNKEGKKPKIHISY